MILGRWYRWYDIFTEFLGRTRKLSKNDCFALGQLVGGWTCGVRTVRLVHGASLDEAKKTMMIVRAARHPSLQDCKHTWDDIDIDSYGNFFCRKCD